MLPTSLRLITGSEAGRKKTRLTAFTPRASAVRESMLDLVLKEEPWTLATRLEAGLEESDAR